MLSVVIVVPPISDRSAGAIKYPRLPYRTLAMAEARLRQLELGLAQPIPRPVSPHELWFNDVLRNGPKIVHSTARNGFLQLCRQACLYKLPLGYKILAWNPKRMLLLVYVAGQESLAQQALYKAGYVTVHVPAVTREAHR